MTPLQYIYWTGVLSLNKKEYVSFKSINGAVKYIIDSATSKKNVSFKYNIDNKSIYTKDFIDTVVYKYQYLDTTHKYMAHLIMLNSGIVYLTDFENMNITPYTSVSDLKKDLDLWLDKYKKDYKNYKEDK